MREFVQSDSGPAGPVQHAYFVWRDGTEPTLEFGIGAPLIAVGECVQQRLLNHVIRVIESPQPRLRESQHRL
jgi:hypothetical protein